MNLRWLVVESSVGLSHQVGAVVEQVFAVDPLAVAHAIALVGDEVLGFAVVHAEGREVVHNPLFDAVVVDVIGFGRRACGEGVLIVVVEVREHARVEGAFAWFEASRKADHEAHVGQLLEDFARADLFWSKFAAGAGRPLASGAMKELVVTMTWAPTRRRGSESLWSDALCLSV